MPAPAALFDVPEPMAAPRRKRVKRAQAGQRKPSRRTTSWTMSAEDELLLDALREAYGTELIGEALRRSVRVAAAAEGIDPAQLKAQEAAAAA